MRRAERHWKTLQYLRNCLGVPALLARVIWEHSSTIMSQRKEMEAHIIIHSNIKRKTSIVTRALYRTVKYLLAHSLSNLGLPSTRSLKSIGCGLVVKHSLIDLFLTIQHEWTVLDNLLIQRLTRNNHEMSF